MAQQAGASAAGQQREATPVAQQQQLLKDPATGQQWEAAAVVPQQR
jgi:hypothetical protein